jgi:hypothetical protein
VARDSVSVGLRGPAAPEDETATSAPAVRWFRRDRRFVYCIRGFGRGHLAPPATSSHQELVVVGCQGEGEKKEEGEIISRLVGLGRPFSVKRQ